MPSRFRDSRPRLEGTKDLNKLIWKHDKIKRYVIDSDATLQAIGRTREEIMEYHWAMDSVENRLYLSFKRLSR